MLMNNFTKIKKIFLIALGFGLSTYLIMSGNAMLNQDSNQTVAPKDIVNKQ